MCQFNMALYTLVWVPANILLVVSVQLCFTGSRALIGAMARIQENLRLGIGVNIYV